MGGYFCALISRLGEVFASGFPQKQMQSSLSFGRIAWENSSLLENQSTLSLGIGFSFVELLGALSQILVWFVSLPSTYQGCHSQTLG